MELLRKLWHSHPVAYLRACACLYTQTHVSQAAGALAYFLLLTIFPLLICATAFLGLLDLDPLMVANYLDGFVPQEGLDLIRVYLAYISGSQSAALFAAGLILSFSSSSAAFRAVTRPLADIYGVPQRKGLQGLLMSLLSPFALILTLFLSIGVIITGDWLLTWLAQEFPWGQNILAWRHLRFVLLFAVLLLFLLILSLLSAPRHTPKGPLLLGGILSTCALVAFSALFSLMISFSTRYSLVYGSLLSIVVLILWLYFCGTILLAGNIFSSVWFRRRTRSAPAGISDR